MSVPPGLEGVVTGVHHLAIAVPSIAEARGLYEDVFGMTALAPEPEYVPSQKVNVLVLHAGDDRIELVEPASPDSPISKFVAERGGGIHHVAWRVASVERALAHMRAHGVQLIHTEPQPGSHGTLVAFLHPRATGRVLCELVEVPATKG